jgi:hypothetical protein
VHIEDTDHTGLGLQKTIIFIAALVPQLSEAVDLSCHSCESEFRLPREHFVRLPTTSGHSGTAVVWPDSELNTCYSIDLLP